LLEAAALQELVERLHTHSLGLQIKIGMEVSQAGTAPAPIGAHSRMHTNPGRLPSRRHCHGLVDKVR
jgi:hypothetical protein